jgi:predicted small lipoprotein YifL
MTRLLLALAMIASLSLAACGVRGPLEPPPGSGPPTNDPYHLDPLL